MISFFYFAILILNASFLEAQLIRRRSRNHNGGFGLQVPAVTSVPQKSQNFVSTPKTDQIIKGIQELGGDVSFNQWAQGDLGNVVVSPLNIATLTGLLLLASRGDSHSELKRTMHLDNNVTDSEIHSIYKDIINYIQNDADSGVEISMDSRLFLLHGLPILGEFTKVAEQSYGSRVRGLFFSESPRESKDIINKWVEKATRGLITNIIEKPFPIDTKFVAVNVMYFNGQWEYPFDELLTENGNFYTGRRNIRIPMMINLLTVPYLTNEKRTFDMVSLPYKGGKFSMIIITPKVYTGVQTLQNIEYFLDYDRLDNLIKLMEPTRISLKIPRMKLRNKMNLKNTFKNLGTKTIFDSEKSDLGRLSTQPGIYIDNILHEAVIEITETGTVAAAASSASFDRLGTNNVFHMDKPSLLYIRDAKTGLMLFSARVMEPESI